MKIKDMAANVVIGILGVIMLGMLGILFLEIHDYSRSYHQEESSFLYNIQEQEYARLVEMMYQNEVSGVKTSATYEECYAVARYYEAATYYKAYKEAGNEMLANEKMQIMEEQASLMGDLSYVAEDILLLLEID